MNYLKKYDRDIRVPVTKKLPKKDLINIVNDFIRQNLTFAISKYENEFEVWRQILPGDIEREKNNKKGMSYGGIIEIDDETLYSRDFVHIWEKGIEVYGSFNCYEKS